MRLGRMCSGVLAFALATTTANRADAYLVGPAVSLQQLAKRVDLVCKATVIADRPVVDSWFKPLHGFEVRDAVLRVISVIKGNPRQRVVHFHYYARSKVGGVSSYSPQYYNLSVGQSYIVFANKGAGGFYRQWARAHTSKADQGVLPAADTRRHRGRTVTQAVWHELQAALASGAPRRIIAAISQLDQLSGGNRSRLRNFGRNRVLAALRRFVASKHTRVAKAAITVYGADSPYFNDTHAVYWLAGIGKGDLPGLGHLTPRKSPVASHAAKQLLAVARHHADPSIRALAMRALGRSGRVPATAVARWRRDRRASIRSAAVLLSADVRGAKLAPHARDRSAAVRRATALAIGFAQRTSLLPVLDRLLKDPSPTVRRAAAMSILSFGPAAAAVMKANLRSNYRPLFINALARHAPRRYLKLLAEVITKHLVPSNWWGGSTPAGVSWRILFDYVKSRPVAELTSSLARSLDALERMKWFSSSEPRALYALYLLRGLRSRARRFRAVTRKAVRYNIDYYFNMADKDPAAFVN